MYIIVYSFMNLAKFQTANQVNARDCNIFLSIENTHPKKKEKTFKQIGSASNTRYTNGEQTHSHCKHLI